MGKKEKVKKEKGRKAAERKGSDFLLAFALKGPSLGMSGRRPQPWDDFGASGRRKEEAMRSRGGAGDGTGMYIAMGVDERLVSDGFIKRRRKMSLGKVKAEQRLEEISELSQTYKKEVE